MRQIESEITVIMYYPSLGAEGPSDAVFDQWFTHAHKRLTEWHNTIRQSINLTEKIEFYELMFHVQMLRLNRSSPRRPDPTRDMHKKALKSSIALIKEFAVIDQMGKLFYLWHATYCIIESGTCLLALALIGMESRGQEPTHMWGEDVKIMMRYIEVFPSLLWKISRRWSSVAQHASVLETLSNSVSEKLQQWSNGEMVLGADIYAFKQKLNRVSLFSPVPSEAEPAIEEHVLPQVTSNIEAERASWLSSAHLDIDDHSGTTENEQYAAFEGTGVAMQSYPAFNSSAFQVSTTDAAALDSGWLGPQPDSQYSSLTFPDLFNISSEEALPWGLAGMGFEEIFAGLLQGEVVPLVNDDVFGSR